MILMSCCEAVQKVNMLQSGAFDRDGGLTQAATERKSKLTSIAVR